MTKEKKKKFPPTRRIIPMGRREGETMSQAMARCWAAVCRGEVELPPAEIIEVQQEDNNKCFRTGVILTRASETGVNPEQNEEEMEQISLF